MLTGCLVAALGADEVRRPLRRIGRRTFGAGLQSGPHAPWHPKLTAIVDEYRRTTQLNEARTAPPMWLLFSVVNEIVSPRLRAQVVFEDAPFRVGGTARVEFAASVEKGFIDGGLTEFRLLCVRESPDVILPWRGGVECLADLEPSKRTDRHAERYVARLEFSLPAGLPASDLTAPQPAYWVFVVIIDRLPGPYREEFFVPVSP